MVHVRLNERETNPNPHVNFITALPAPPKEHDEARQLLRALAAQVRPVMKAHGFVVNSLEEYEYNEVFAGRNWNNGETVELVLRRQDGSYQPIFWLMSTFCHELAHIKHMNHGTAFQALWKQLRSEVRALQDKGYYGDGYWSSGTRLADSARIGGQGIEAGDFPEYMCGGAQARKRPTALRRRRARQPRDSTIVASTKTGRQTAKKRKVGARVTSKSAFVGDGVMLAEVGDASGKGKGTGFGKQAGSKRAREERALAAERRMQALQTESRASASNSVANSDDESNDDSDEEIRETDSDRRQTLLASEQDDDLQGLKSGSSWEDFENDFKFGSGTMKNDDVIDISDDEEQTCDVLISSGQPVASGSGRQDSHQISKQRDKDKSMKSQQPIKNDTLGIGKLVQSEINLRKKESLGMAPIKRGGRSLAAGTPTIPSSISQKLKETPPSREQWPCLICTLLNDDDHLACSACATPRGEENWSQ